MFDVWKNVLAELEQVIPHSAFAMWFTGTTLVENKDGRVVIGTTNVFKKTQLEKRYDAQIREALTHAKVNFQTVEYEVQGESRILRRPREITVDEVSRTAESTDELKGRGFKGGELSDKFRGRFTSDKKSNGLSPDYSMDNFVIGQNNNVAVAVARGIIDDPGGRFNPFFLYGGPGLGKTHLVQAIGNELARKFPRKKILYITTSDFYSEFIRSLKSKQADSFTQKFRALDVLIVDDFQMIMGKEASQNAFFDVFNDLYQRRKQIIVTSDRSPDQIKTLDKRLSSRLAMTGPIDLQLPNYEDRCAILHMKAEFMGKEVENEVIEYIANNIKTNVRELEGEFNKILLIAEVKGIRPIEVIRDGYVSQAQARRKNTVSAQAIVAKTAAEYDLSVEELQSKSRVTKTKTARQVAMYLLQEELGMSTTKIALEVGVKDHTTVMNGTRKIRRDMEVDYGLRDTIEKIRSRLYE